MDAAASPRTRKGEDWKGTRFMARKKTSKKKSTRPAKPKTKKKVGKPAAIKKPSAESVRQLEAARRATRREAVRDRKDRIKAYRNKLAKATRRPEGAMAGPTGLRLRILAEGDSWFDFPRILRTGGGVVSHLEDISGLDILNLAHAGDEVRHLMGVEQRVRLEEMLGDEEFRFNVLLFSGGGNDLVGDQLCLWVRERREGMTPADALNAERVRDAMDLVEIGYRELIALRDRHNPNCRIVTHGYDFPQPSDDGICGLGPWIKPSLDYRGWRNPAEQFAIAQALLLSFHELQVRLEQEQQSAGRPFLYVRTQGRLDPGTHWHDEIHPNSDGFDIVAQAFADALGIT
jgi:hypothetical protein